MKKLFEILIPPLLVLIVAYIFSNFYPIKWISVYIASSIFFMMQICIYIKNPKGVNETWLGLAVWGTFATMTTAIDGSGYLEEILSVISASIFALYIISHIIPQYYDN